MENDIYTPNEQLDYKCNFNFVEHDNDNRNIYKCGNIYICAYSVNTDRKDPFMRYLLTNYNRYEDKLDFPMVPRLAILKNMNAYIDFAYECLLGILKPYDKDNTVQKTIFNGYYIFNNNIYLFYDITKCNIQLYDIYRNNNVWFVLVDEIVNHRHICNVPIDDNTTNLLIENEELCFLVDKHNNNYQVPIIGYVPTSGNKLTFTYAFGQTTSNKNGIFGPFYYFSDLFTSFKTNDITNPFMDLSANINYTNEGVVRFAIFLGSHKLVENFLTDPTDESEIKKQRLNDENLNTNIERLTMRISDHDGKWSHNYDSIYLGPLELDDGMRLNCNLLAIKEYNQQIPLSYHYIDQHTLGYDVCNFRII
jgi:hypothetical protein